MEITVKINGRFVSVEVSAEVAGCLEQARRNNRKLYRERQRYWDGREFDEYIISTGRGFWYIQRRVICHPPASFSPAVLILIPLSSRKTRREACVVSANPLCCSLLACTPGTLLFWSVDHFLFLRYPIAWILRRTVSVPPGRLHFSAISESVIFG